MRTICLSDTHWTDETIDNLKLPDGDLLIHAGDATFNGGVAETMKFCEWFAKQPHDKKIFVPGNHDKWFTYARWATPDNVEVLIDRLVTVNGLRIYGTPAVKDLPKWAFNRTEDQISQSLSHLTDVDILVTHAPPYGILDAYLPTEANANKYGIISCCWENLGSKAIRSALDRLQPKLHIFGHIHDAYGVAEFGLDTICANVAICNDKYELAHKPIIIDLEISR